MRSSASGTAAGSAPMAQIHQLTNMLGLGAHPLPISKCSAIPEPPAEGSGSADEDDADEGPQVVVLKKGEHLMECEAENAR